MVAGFFSWVGERGGLLYFFFSFVKVREGGGGGGSDGATEAKM